MGEAITIFFSVHLNNVFCISGLATLLTTFMLRLLGETDLAIALDWVFLVLFPHYNFGKSINDMFVNYSNLDYCFSSNSTNLCAEKPSCCKGQSLRKCNITFRFVFPDWSLCFLIALNHGIAFVLSTDIFLLIITILN